jgi:hypothetical protein
MALSPNYGWAEPDNSSLVKNGAQDIRALGDAIDTSLWNVGFGQAGKNKIINGDFGIWQRGTSFSNPSSSAYTADRWQVSHNGTGATRTISQQTFTPGTAPVAGYEANFFYRYALSAVGTGNTYQLIQQPIEDVRTFAGQTVTLSFWAKAGSSATIQTDFDQYFGSGGSSDVYSAQASHSVTTSWTRFSQTVTLGTMTGKTIGAGSFLAPRILPAAATTITLDIWGVQVEYGSKATPFETATGTIQGELAACQRYCQMYQPTAGNTDYLVFGGTVDSSAYARYPFVFPVVMRLAPTLTTSGTANNYANLNASGRQLATAVPTLETARTFSASVTCTSGGLSTGQATSFRNGDGTGGYLLFTAEL